MLLIKRKKDSLPFNIRTHSKMRFESGEINGHFEQWGVRRGEVGRTMAIDNRCFGKKEKKKFRPTDHVIMLKRLSYTKLHNIRLLDIMNAKSTPPPPRMFAAAHRMLGDRVSFLSTNCSFIHLSYIIITASTVSTGRLELELSVPSRLRSASYGLATVR
jgi:hypothetical protein